MMYNNNPCKVNELDRMLKVLADEKCSDGHYFEFFERDYLTHLIPESKLDNIIEEVRKCIADGDDDIPINLLNLNNEPVHYKGNLVFGIGKYLHWFRGYYYQVSSTPDGNGTVESPYFGMQYLMNVVYNAERYGPSEYKGIKEFVLAISAMTTGLAYYDAMKKMLSNEDGVKEFNEFLMADITQHESGKFNFDTQSILDMFEEYSCDNVPSDILLQNCVLLENNYSKQQFCVLSIDKESITTVMPLKSGKLRVLRFKLPMWYTDPDRLYLDKDEEEDDYVNPFKATSYAMESFVQFVLAYSGIKIYSGGMYAVGSSFDREKSVHANIASIDDTSKLADFISENV